MVSALTLPPAPNWFSSGLVSAGPSGWVVYGAKNSLVLVQHQEPEELEGGWRERRDREKSYPRVHLHQEAHGDRAKVCCVSWCPSPSPLGLSLASAAEDGCVRVWRWQDTAPSGPSLTLALQHSVSAASKARVTGLSWSRPDPGLLLSADDSGALVVWHLVDNTTRAVVFGRNTIFCLAAHPEDADIAAFGCKLGLVFIVSIRGSGRVIHRMRGHDEDVYSVAWSPGDNTRIGEERHSEYLLASSSRDKTARIWSSSQGRVVHSVRVPSQFKGGKGRNEAQPAWISLAWPQPATLLTSGAGGELVSWDLEKPGKKGGSEFSVLHREHFKNLFGIAVCGRVAYTVGQDRSVVATNLDTARITYNLPCFAGFVYTMASNPIDPSILAVGAGDSQIRVWRTGGEQLFDVTNIHAKLNQCKVMSLAWHPSREGLLAFGTDEGRVGWVEALGGSRMANFSSSQHRGGVYSVTWGPSVVGEGEGVALYSCGDGKVLQHSMKTGKATDIQESLDKANSSEGARPAGRSQVLWLEREEGRLLLLGCDDGTVEIYRLPSLALAATLKSAAKLIQSLSLAPSHLADGSEVAAEHSLLLAAASNDHPVHVFDLRPVLALEEGSQALLVVTPTKVLTGHLQRVIELCWSPHTEARLCSVSYDFSAQVWDVSTSTPLHNFPGHSGRVMCCLWHPTQDLVLTGGEEGVLQGWRPKEQKGSLPLERRREKRGKSAKPEGVAEATAAAKDSKEDVKEPEVEEAKAELSFDELLARHRAEQNKAKEVTANGDHKEPFAEETSKDASIESRVKKVARKENKKSSFPVSAAAEMKARKRVGEDCIKILEINKRVLDKEQKVEEVGAIEDTVLEGLEKLALNSDKTDDKDESDLHLGFFTDDRASMHRLLDSEASSLCGDPSLSSQLSLWSGSLGPLVEEAVLEGRVTERLVALCAGTSTALWRRAARGLGGQLVRAGEALRGAEYLVAAGAVREAVTELSREGQHRAALAIARSRLPRGDPAAREVLVAWARQSQGDGNFSLAARCWVGAGDNQKAAETLARLGDRSSLRAAALLVGGEGRGRLYARQALTHSLYSGDPVTALQLVREQPSLHWALPLSSLHTAVLAAARGGGGREKGLLELVREKLREEEGGKGMEEGWKEETASFLATSTHGEERERVLLQFSGLLCSSLPPCEPRAALGAVAKALHLLLPHPALLASLLAALLPKGSQGPEAGQAILGQPLDIQCNWMELRSLQTSEGASLLASLEKDSTSLLASREKDGSREKEEEQLELLADSIMLEDVIKEQKLQAEIEEGEREVAKFKPDLKALENGVKDAEAEKEADKGAGGLDLTPSLAGTQTLSLSGPGGEWQSQGVSDSVPLPGGAPSDSLPPPPPASRSFHQRFLVGQSSTEMAVKEIQKLKWCLDRTRSTSPSSPFPCLSLLCSRLVTLMEARNLGGPPADQAPDEQMMGKLGLRQRVARWCYYHGARGLQEFFLQHA